MIAVNIACTCPTVSSVSSTSPRYGPRYRLTCAAYPRTVEAAGEVRETSQCASQSPTVMIPPVPPAFGFRSRASTCP